MTLVYFLRSQPLCPFAHQINKVSCLNLIPRSLLPSVSSTLIHSLSKYLCLSASFVHLRLILNLWLQFFIFGTWAMVNVSHLLINLFFNYLQTRLLMRMLRTQVREQRSTSTSVCSSAMVGKAWQQSKGWRKNIFTEIYIRTSRKRFVATVHWFMTLNSDMFMFILQQDT